VSKALRIHLRGRCGGSGDMVALGDVVDQGMWWLWECGGSGDVVALGMRWLLGMWWLLGMRWLRGCGGSVGWGCCGIVGWGCGGSVGFGDVVAQLAWVTG
jgi:hypothetical protein